MKLMVLVPPSDCTPSVDIFWFTVPAGTPCHIEYVVEATWSNPCAGSFAISYVYHLYWEISGVWTLEYTSGTLTGTVGTGTTVITDDFVPGVGTPTASEHAYWDLVVTWPGGAIVTYTSPDDYTAVCA